jgi:uncharacterized membrane protein
MHKGRLEAFSDGVIAIIITIMVLELKVPHGETLDDLLPLWPVLLSYVLSFIYVGIYWSNHHHLMQTVHHVNGAVLWANLHLLFWLSIVPFVTAWMGENHFASMPVAAYGAVLLAASIAYFILTRTLLAVEGQDSSLARAVGRDIKGGISTALYIAALPMAFFNVWLACGVYALVAALWLVPDRRIERVIAS